MDSVRFILYFASLGIGINQYKDSVFGLGSGEHGQVGNGRTGEYIATGNKMMYDVHSEPGKAAFVFVRN